VDAALLGFKGLIEEFRDLFLIRCHRAVLLGEMAEMNDPR
jgi:hypothetical protein